MRLPPERLSLLRDKQARQGQTRTPLPTWMRAKLPGGERYATIKQNLRARGLATVCEEAQCPNIGECWNEGTATLMLMGETCTRACRFCAVRHAAAPAALDPDEPSHAAEQVALMGLDYVVMTSVNRDELPDGGAAHLRACIEAVRARNPDTLVEVLMPDFQGVEADIATVVAGRPHVFAHNIETVERLSRSVRDRRASFGQSLEVLRHAKAAATSAGEAMLTKSSIMVGLGETHDEVVAAMRALRDVDCDALTLGQYLRPSPWHHEVVRFATPEEFDAWRVEAEAMGFRYVASGPMVRSSYRAGEFYLAALVRGDSAATG
jgi:lipoic acid synthetase